MVLVSLLVLLPNMGPKWPRSQALLGCVWGEDERKPGTAKHKTQGGSIKGK